MQPLIYLSIQILLVVVGVVALAIVLHRRLAAPWRLWALGALSFVGSQVVRIPLLLLLGLLLNPVFANLGPTIALWFNIVVLTISSGLFEETARYVVLRWLARTPRRYEDALMFGAGHGGIEALLVIGVSFVSSVVLLQTGDALLQTLRSTAPEQVTALATQIDTLRALTWWQPLLGVWERVLAVTLHIGLSLLVWRTLIERTWRWWAVAVASHALFNAVAVITVRYAGAVATEAVLTVLTIVPILIILRARRWSFGAPTPPIAQPA